MKSEELDDFCKLLIEVMRTLKKSSEMPAYMNNKARDLNAAHVLKKIEEAIEEHNILKQFTEAHNKQVICSDEEFRRSDDFINALDELESIIDRIADSGFRLMLERFLAAHDLAVKVKEITEELKGETAKSKKASK